VTVKGLARHKLVVGYQAPANVDAWVCENGHRIAVPTDLGAVPKYILCDSPGARSLMQCGKTAFLRKARAATGPF
jgi:hypothetical protein